MVIKKANVVRCVNTYEKIVLLHLFVSKLNKLNKFYYYR